MQFRRFVTFTVLALAAHIASAAVPRAFTQQDFDTLTRAGKPVIVDISAVWCPTCKAQKPIVEKLAVAPAYKDVTVLRVDFDSEKPILKEFHVTTQSTLIAFNAGKETARSVGDTTSVGIESLFLKAAK
jgi:thioredoxin 1